MIDLKQVYSFISSANGEIFELIQTKNFYFKILRDVFNKLEIPVNTAIKSLGVPRGTFLNWVKKGYIPLNHNNNMDIKSIFMTHFLNEERKENRQKRLDTIALESRKIYNDIANFIEHPDNKNIDELIILFRFMGRTKFMRTTEDVEKINEIIQALGIIGLSVSGFSSQLNKKTATSEDSLAE